MTADLKHISSESLKDPLTRWQRPEDWGSEGAKPDRGSDGERASSCWATAIVFIVLTGNCVAAVYHSHNDPWSVAFVLISFGILVSLFYALRLFETLPRESPGRAHVKAAVWVLSTVLTLMFSHRVAWLMPFPVAVLVWVMAVSTISAGFYMFFVCPDGATTMTAEEEPAKIADIA